MKKRLQDYLFLFLIAGLIILLDQLTKTWIRQNLHVGEIFMPELWISNYARILFWKNTGAAFGILQNFGTVFMGLSFVVSAVIIYYFPQISRKDWVIRLAMSLLLAGAVGNLIDRLTVGYVTDFISVGNFPVFNIADSSITVGVIVLFIGMWIQEHREKSQAEPLETTQDGTSQSSGNAATTEEMRGE